MCFVRVNCGDDNLVLFIKCICIYKNAFRSCVIRGCDLTVLDDQHEGNPMVETKMTRGVTSLTLQDMRMFDMICMYLRNTRDTTSP